MATFAGNPVADPIDGTESIPLTQGGVDKRVTPLSLAVELVNSQSGTSYTYVTGDRSKLVSHSNAAAIAGTLPEAGADFPNGWFMDVQNVGVGTLTITPTTSGIDGQATLVLATGQGARIVSDGANYFTQRGAGGDVKGPAGATADNLALFDGTSGKLLKNGGTTVAKLRLQSIQVACSDETTALTTGAAKVTLRMPYAFTLIAVRASLTIAQASGSIFTVDINESGASILSTKLTIDNTETTSTTAATPPVISDTSLADDAELTFDIDQIGNGSAKGLKVTLIGYVT